ncbi:unnamed protein product [Cylindrotheca closterium]|uniref:subtilisin n=1 Tax=Cylindrotheca closterium TaxID=2856 RepID=A0AAD2JL66_9STRA|nr:unnamed protein product [Cylindrotheca closterium]
MMVRHSHSMIVLLSQVLLGCLLASVANCELFDFFDGGVDRTDTIDTAQQSSYYNPQEAGGGGGGDDEEMIKIMVGFRDKGDGNNYKRNQRMQSRDGSSKSKITYEFQNTNGMAMEVTRAEFEQMKQDPAFSTVEEDVEVRVATPATPTANNNTMEAHERWLAEARSYGLAMTQADQAIPVPPSEWSQCVAYMCIVDSGVYVNHNDIPYNRNDGYTDGSAFGQAAGDQWWNPIKTPHGTNVAGIMFATGGNDAGMVGVIPQHPSQSKVCLRVAKVFPNGQEVTSVSAILQAVEWCASVTARNNKPMVINLSLATDIKTSTEERVYQRVYDQGVLIVGAAGNLGNAKVSYPASHRSVMSVGSVSSNKQRSSFSQYNDFLEIVGPGTDILATNADGSSIGTLSGTSFAAPYVAAIAARIWARNPHCSNEQVRSSLRDSAIRLGNGVPNQEYGYGLVQAVAAYNNLVNKNCNKPTPAPTPYPTTPPTPPPTPGPTLSPSKMPTNVPSMEPTAAPSIEPTETCQQRLFSCERDEDCCRGLVCAIDSLETTENWVCRASTDSGMRNKPRLSQMDNSQCRGGFAGGCSKYDSW